MHGDQFEGSGDQNISIMSQFLIFILVILIWRAEFKLTFFPYEIK
uniref:Uncharacterized protein n=1 Tax=Rhizophora mucronata TaxID=61149 RepID=A0A2P2QFI7_RHIMU